MWLTIKLSVIAAALALTACSSQHSSQYDKTRLVIDWEQVNRVERANRGTASVIWINYPYKRIDSDGRVVERINRHGEVIARYVFDENDSATEMGSQ
ncbi:hypothetical protein ACR0ST_04465 [Aliidiomarina sp. Khilg15.8]